MSSHLIQCPLCKHLYEPSEITKHHLIPKSRKGKVTIGICSPCHKQIHAVYSEKELERSYGTLEKLLEAPELQSWLRWIRRRKPTKRIRTRVSQKNSRRRYAR
jgi:5-methylcytosine-specific restriction protein A